MYDSTHPFLSVINRKCLIYKFSSPKFNPQWNEDDGGIDRRSFEQKETIKYDVVEGKPLNPRGRTGLSGRGRLGRWGPNHAGDAIVTRYYIYFNLEKFSANIKFNDNLRLLKFCKIDQREEM